MTGSFSQHHKVLPAFQKRELLPAPQKKLPAFAAPGATGTAKGVAGLRETRVYSRHRQIQPWLRKVSDRPSRHRELLPPPRYTATQASNFNASKSKRDLGIETDLSRHSTENWAFPPFAALEATPGTAEENAGQSGTGSYSRHRKGSCRFSRHRKLLPAPQRNRPD